MQTSHESIVETFFRLNFIQILFSSLSEQSQTSLLMISGHYLFKAFLNRETKQLPLVKGTKKEREKLL